MKRCVKCGGEKLPVEFGKDASRKDGLFPWCRECCRESDKERYAKTPEKFNERSKNWKKSNREKANAIERAWNAINQDRARERKRKWKKLHPEQNKVIQKVYRFLNADKVREWVRNRRAKIKGNGGVITNHEWQEVLEKYGNMCIYPGCGSKNVTMDHVVPIKLGGLHVVDNVQPLCRTHNSSKGTNIIDYRKGEKR